MVLPLAAEVAHQILFILNWGGRLNAEVTHVAVKSLLAHGLLAAAPVFGPGEALIPGAG